MDGSKESFTKGEMTGQFFLSLPMKCGGSSFFETWANHFQVTKVKLLYVFRKFLVTKVTESY